MGKASTGQGEIGKHGTGGDRQARDGGRSASTGRGEIGKRGTGGDRQAREGGRSAGYGRRLPILGGFTA